MKKIKKLFGLVVSCCILINLIFALMIYLFQFSKSSNIYLFVSILIQIVMYKTCIDQDFFQYVKGFWLRHKFCKVGKNLRIQKNVAIFNPKCISIGNNCTIGHDAVLAPLDATGHFQSQIFIGNNVYIGIQNRIASMDKVIIEDDVLFSSFVHITDHSHVYRDITKPIKKQGVYSKGKVHIKKGAWIAFGAHILSGVTIGEGAVVAANAVVTKNVPAYSVVAGNPAKIVYKWDYDEGKWLRGSNYE